MADQDYYSASDGENEELVDIGDIQVEPSYQTISKQGKIEWVKMDPIEFVNVACWPYNRNLDWKRVNELYRGILKTGGVHGGFTIARLDGEMWLIDGQHRQRAIEKIIEDDKDDFDIICQIIDVDDESEIIERFVVVNNSKPLTPRDTPSTLLIRIIKNLTADFPDSIKMNSNRTIYPYILAKDLRDKLDGISFGDNTAEDVYKEIRRLNKEYMKIAKSTGAGNIPNSRRNVSPSAVNKAFKSGFYLGFDEKWSWIEKLEERLSSD